MQGGNLAPHVVSSERICEENKGVHGVVVGPFGIGILRWPSGLRRNHFDRVSSVDALVGDLGTGGLSAVRGPPGCPPPPPHGDSRSNQTLGPVGERLRTKLSAPSAGHQGPVHRLLVASHGASRWPDRSASCSGPTSQRRLRATGRPRRSPERSPCGPSASRSAPSSPCCRRATLGGAEATERRHERTGR